MPVVFFPVYHKSCTQAIKFPTGSQHNPAKKAPPLAKRGSARSGPYSSPTYLLYHFLSGAARLKLHKSFAASLAYLRIDESQGLWYSIVTERKQPEIRSRQLQEKLTFQGEILEEISKESKTPAVFRKEGGSSPMANFKDPIHHRRAWAC